MSLGIQVTTDLLGLVSRFATAVAGVSRSSNAERKALDSELRTIPGRGTGRKLVP